MDQILKTLKEVIHFTKHPSDKNKAPASFIQNLNLLIRLLIILFIIVSLILILFHYINTYTFDFKSYGKFDDAFANKTLVSILFLVSVLAPVLEEVIFRLPLKYSRNYIFRGIDYIFKTKKVYIFWTKNYHFFYYTSIVAFGLVHLTNYDLESYWFLALAPIIILPQLLAGIVLSFIRMKSGLLWAISLHSLYNGILTIGGILFFNTTTITNDNNESYSLKIEQITYGLKKEIYSNSKIKNDSLHYFEVRNNSLRNILKQLNENPQHYKNLNTRLNILLEKNDDKLHKKVITTELRKHFSIKEQFTQ
ncbi:hypothetical protein GCM10009430_15040 [Aquimarina litoralis]|uniref:CAAX prenyl protease 2/Lysostaphin resistance protein A-like domain-containing protein n=1 Tax=Aquimarina litoralis TaxID=584605 RepID=A0ABP3TTP0_9FLAO